MTVPRNPYPSKTTVRQVMHIERISGVGCWPEGFLHIPSRTIHDQRPTWQIGVQCARRCLSTMAGVAHGTHEESEDNRRESDRAQDLFPLGFSVVDDGDGRGVEWLILHSVLTTRHCRYGCNSRLACSVG